VAGQYKRDYLFITSHEGVLRIKFVVLYRHRELGDKKVSGPDTIFMALEGYSISGFV